MNTAWKLVQDLFGHYKSYHQNGPRMLWYAGIMGAVGFPAFYLLRFTKSTLPYDDLMVRLIAAALCSLLLLKNYWPRRLKPYFLAYSYFALIYTLPVAFVFTSLKNGGGVVAVANTMMVVFFVILMTDWRNTIAMLVLGFGAAVALYVATDPSPKIPIDYVMRFPVLLLVGVGGIFFKLASNQAAAEKMRLGYASIAGSIAHEMRNPLGQLKHTLERIQDALPAPSTTPQAQLLPAGQVDALYSHLAEGDMAVRRGLQVISMSLDEVSSRPLDVASFSHVSAAEATVKAMQEYGYESDEARARVSLKVVENFSFRGDETAYLFVLFNLIKNALYYLPLHPGARLEITVDRHRVLVRDSGPGIAPQTLARLFEPFSSTGKTGGTGLGLAYCKRVMRAFGGDIACESVLGQYTEFAMSFPPISAQDSEAHRLAVLGRAQAAFHGKRLLVVDDDAALRVVTRHKLQPLGAVIDEAQDGQSALNMLARQHYDLVVLDLNMPGLDGYAVAARIRDGFETANPRVCIVAHAAELAHVASVKVQKAGMDGFVAKPCAQLPLVEALQRALERPMLRLRTDSVVLAGRTVLLADDNPYNRKAVAAYLKHAGVTVFEADHGQAVLDLLASREGWDAIFMDINMPGMDGVQTARAIRRGGTANCGVPIIALSAHSNETIVAAALAAGMEDVLSKPVDASTLYARLGRLPRQRPVPLEPLRTKPDLQPDGAGPSLLNEERLLSLRHIGILEELLGDCVPAMGQLVARLERTVASEDMPDSTDVLHSLLGLSGEAGASALHHLVRQAYVPMLEHRQWPPAGWLSGITSTALRTELALTAWVAQRDTARTNL